MNESLGAYIPLSHLDREIELTYWPNRYTVQWSQCGMIPDVVANYLSSIEIGLGSRAASYVKATVSYLLNELVENSVKFYLSGTIGIRVGIHSDELILVLANQISKDEKPTLVKQFSDLLQSDPEEVFVARMEATDPGERGGASNLGLLSMMMDYHAQLGWNFSPVDDNEERFWMHTMVRVPYRSDAQTQ